MKRYKTGEDWLKDYAPRNMAMLQEMLEIQRAHDEWTFEAFGIRNGYADCDLDAALLDEVGELNHELKPFWCWWKRGGKYINHSKCLEEWADCMHFILAKIIKAGPSAEKRFLKRAENLWKNKDSSWPNRSKTYHLCDLPGEKLSLYLADYMLYIPDQIGATFEQTYEAYKAKNAVNKERVLQALEREKENGEIAQKEAERPATD